MKRLLLLIAALAAVAIVAAGCGQNNSIGTHTAQVQIAVVKQDVADIEDQLKELRAAEPLPHFHDSAALHVQNAYYTADADPNKEWYVSIVSMTGTLLQHFTTRGAPQPSGDQVTNPAQLYCQHIGNGTHIPDGCGTIGLPEPNGVHQGSDSGGYVAILTTGAVVRFSCAAVYCYIGDQPVNEPKSVPSLSINESAPVSATDTSKTTNPTVPHGTSERTK